MSLQLKKILLSGYKTLANEKLKVIKDQPLEEWYKKLQRYMLQFYAELNDSTKYAANSKPSFRNKPSTR